MSNPRSEPHHLGGRLGRKGRCGRRTAGRQECPDSPALQLPPHVSELQVADFGAGKVAEKDQHRADLDVAWRMLAAQMQFVAARSRPCRQGSGAKPIAVGAKRRW